jgi:hypothetical protein
MLFDRRGREGRRGWKIIGLDLGVLGVLGGDGAR